MVNEAGADERHIVRIGAHRFDPRAEASRARRNAAADKQALAAALGTQPLALAAEGEEPEVWLLQFADTPDARTADHFRQAYGLRLSHGLSARVFIERMPTETADRLRRERRVRACIPYTSDMKSARSSFRSAPVTGTPRHIRIGLLEPAGAGLERTLAALGFHPTAPASAFLGGYILRVEADEGADPTALLLLGDVEWIEDIRRRQRANAGASAVAQGADDRGDHPIWDHGIHGEGEVIGVFDSGVPAIDHDFFRDPDLHWADEAHRKVLEIRAAEDAPFDNHATQAAGCAVGDDLDQPGAHPNRGGAWAAKMVYTDFFYRRPQPENLAAAYRAVYRAGARVFTESLVEPHGFDPDDPGPYTASMAAYDAALWSNEYLLLCAAKGNTGEKPDEDVPGGAPAASKNPLTVSGTWNVPHHEEFSTGVPGTVDERRKPDLVAVASMVETATLRPDDKSFMDRAFGTSFATPHVAAAGALVRQYFRDGYYPSGRRKTPEDERTPSGALVKAVLLNATVDLPDEPGYPSTRAGWGRLKLADTLYFEGDPRILRVADVPHVSGFEATDARFSRSKQGRLTVPRNVREMKVTLVFNDPPGRVGSGDPVVNRMYLLVAEPKQATMWGDGWVLGYYSNHFDDEGRSRRVPLGTTEAAELPTAQELRNNVHQVVVESPVPGEWLIAVFPVEIDENHTPPELRQGRRAQGFGLVARLDLG